MQYLKPVTVLPATAKETGSSRDINFWKHDIKVQQKVRVKAGDFCNALLKAQIILDYKMSCECLYILSAPFGD